MGGGLLGYLPFPIATEFISSAVSTSLLSSAKYKPPKRECLPEVLAMAAVRKVPGATIATILMLGALHARWLYDDKMIEEAREKGVELEVSPCAKARFLRLLPLRSISRFWVSLTSMNWKRFSYLWRSMLL